MPKSSTLINIVDEEPIALLILSGLILLGSILSLAFGLAAASCWYFFIEQADVKLPISAFEKTALILRSHQSVFWVSTLFSALCCFVYFRYRLRQRLMQEYRN